MLPRVSPRPAPFTVGCGWAPGGGGGVLLISLAFSGYITQGLNVEANLYLTPLAR